MMIISYIIISYLIGSIPTAFLFARVSRRIDIRKFGSGNIGATNAFRVLGKGAGISVLILDIFKGLFVTVVLAPAAAPVALSLEVKAVLLGLVAIMGHIWTIFLKFKGGKGIATSLGVMLGLAFIIPGLNWALSYSLLVWLAVFLGFGYVSLASISCAVLLPLFTFLFVKSAPVLVFSLLIVSVMIFSHKSNIRRLLEKKEPRVKLPWRR